MEMPPVESRSRARNLLMGLQDSICAGLEQLDGGGSAMLRRKIEALGVTVHTSKATKVIEPDAEGEARLRMQFADG